MASDTTRQILLDVSRTVSRIGLGAETGVDRVERAYIAEVLERAPSPLFLTRIAKAVALLDRSGMEAILSVEPNECPLDVIGRLSRRLPEARRRLESRIRAGAIDWAFQPRLGPLLDRSLPRGSIFLSVGHANLSRGLFDALGARDRMRCVLVHDMIPLDYPDFARSGTVARFEEKMRVVGAAADRVICNSAHTAARAEHWFESWGRVPELLTVPLGVPKVERVDRQIGYIAPEFVILGTIEPRKNHRLLLDIWDQFHKTLPPELIPKLHIVGRRGWGAENVLQTLDNAGFMGRTVFEHGYLEDEHVRDLLARCRAVLFPSFAEGFGLPLAEALQNGVPVVASDLPCFHEISETGVTYLSPHDRDGWIKAIMEMAEAPNQQAARLDFPGWNGHFERLWKALES